jgi:hypothetical protein
MNKHGKTTISFTIFVLIEDILIIKTFCGLLCICNQKTGIMIQFPFLLISFRTISHNVRSE